MQTDRIRVTSEGEGKEAVLLETEKFAQYAGLDRTAAMRLRLLSEELLGMIAGITEDFSAEFWIETIQRGGCRIHLCAETDMDYAKKRDLIAVSTSGKNERSRGFMSRIRDMIENSFYAVDEGGAIEAETSEDGMLMYGVLGMGDVNPVITNPMPFTWSLEKYRSEVDAEKGTNEAAAEAWDEMEKSIVASIADDVRVSVSGNKAEIVVEKRTF